MKLVVPETESEALRRFLTNESSFSWVSSALLTVESRRNVRRHGPLYTVRLEALLETVTQFAIDETIITSASLIPGDTLRSLDAIHLATALLIRGELETFVTYDKHLAAAAEQHGLNVVSPT